MHLAMCIVIHIADSVKADRPHEGCDIRRTRFAPFYRKPAFIRVRCASGAAPASGGSVGDFFVTEGRERAGLFCMFEGHADKVSLYVEIEVNIFAHFTSLRDFIRRKGYKSGVGVREIFDRHFFDVPLNPRSKNAL